VAIQKTHPDDESRNGTSEQGKRPCPWPSARDDVVLAILWMAVVVGFLALAIFAVLKSL